MIRLVGERVRRERALECSPNCDEADEADRRVLELV